MSENTAPDNSERVAEPLPIDYRRIEVVDPQMAGILRGKTVAQRLFMVQQAHRTGQGLLAMGVRLQHPDWDDIAVKKEVARRMLNGTN